LSASWGYPIDATSEQIFQQFAAQGQSYFNCSGDGDAWIGSPFQPCDDPHVTVVGGTTLSTSGTNGSWASETVWNSGILPGGNRWNVDGFWGSSGGISTTYAIPSWQTNISMTTNLGSSIFRNVPDVALTADNIFIVYGGGQQAVAIGTSCATPLWAGYCALVNQQALANGNRSVGFLNPALYAIAKTASYTNCFHDTTTGNNTWDQSPNLFFAVPGYDLATGLGTPNGVNLINALAGNGFITPISAPAAPYGTTLAALNGGNPNGTWSLFVQDDSSPDSGAISNGWFLTLTVGSPVGFSADNALAMTASVTNVLIGTNFNYTITVTNYGPSSSSNVVVLDTLPSSITLVSSNSSPQFPVSRNGTQVSWNIGTLTNNAGAQLTLTLHANSAGTFINSANVGANISDGNSDNNSASVAVNAVASFTPPQFSSIAASNNGTFSLTILSPTTANVIVQASTNLFNWVNIYTNTPPFTFTDLQATNYPSGRFYRALFGP